MEGGACKERRPALLSSVPCSKASSRWLLVWDMQGHNSAKSGDCKLMLSQQGSPLRDAVLGSIGGVPVRRRDPPVDPVGGLKCGNTLHLQGCFQSPCRQQGPLVQFWEFHCFFQAKCFSPTTETKVELASSRHRAGIELAPWQLQRLNFPSHSQQQTAAGSASEPAASPRLSFSAGFHPLNKSNSRPDSFAALAPFSLLWLAGRRPTNPAEFRLATSSRALAKA